jgi:hypothetical protein
MDGEDLHAPMRTLSLSFAFFFVFCRLRVYKQRVVAKQYCWAKAYFSSLGCIVGELARECPPDER